MLFKNSVLAALKTHYFFIRNVRHLMLFEEMIAVYSETFKKHINAFYGQNA
jgi:hypothetical protein